MTYTATVYHGLTHEPMQEPRTDDDLDSLIQWANGVLEDYVEREVIAITDDNGNVVWKRGFIGDQIVQYVERMT